jgi:outer membrane PBP1 activator LpoA protein
MCHCRCCCLTVFIVAVVLQGCQNGHLPESGVTQQQASASMRLPLSKLITSSNCTAQQLARLAAPVQARDVPNYEQSHLRK